MPPPAGQLDIDSPLARVVCNCKGHDKRVLACYVQVCGGNCAGARSPPQQALLACNSSINFRINQTQCVIRSYKHRQQESCIPRLNAQCRHRGKLDQVGQARVGVGGFQDAGELLKPPVGSPECKLAASISHR